jgi:hypothetical protein
LLSRSSGFVLRICRRWVSGEREVREQAGLGPRQQLGDGWEAGPEAVDHPVELLPGAHAVGLLDNHADRAGNHAPGTPRHEVLGVAGQVHPAPLPSGTEELLVDRLHQPGVVVADDQADAAD